MRNKYQNYGNYYNFPIKLDIYEVVRCLFIRFVCSTLFISNNGYIPMYRCSKGGAAQLSDTISIYSSMWCRSKGRFKQFFLITFMSSTKWGCFKKVRISPTTLQLILCSCNAVGIQFVCQRIYVILIVFFLLFTAITSAHEITQLKVPLYADPRQAAELSCHFSMDDQRLHSVKWYRDVNEIFRYNPSQKVIFKPDFYGYLIPQIDRLARRFVHCSNQVIIPLFRASCQAFYTC